MDEPSGDHELGDTQLIETQLIETQLIETMRFTPPDDLRNLASHLARLTRSAAFFGFRCDLAAVEGELTGAVAGLTAGRTAPARVRLLLFRSGAVTVELAELPPSPPGPVTLVVDEVPVDSASPWLRHKTTRREIYTDRVARHPDADDVILVNERGEVTETTIANLAVLIDGRWRTPPVSSGCLPGVERARLLATGDLDERVINVAALRTAPALAVLNSLRGWRSAELHG